MNLTSIPLKLGITFAASNTNTDQDKLVISLFLGACLLIILFAIVFLLLNNYYQSNGIIPSFWKKKEKHLVDIYARLSGLLILKERKEINAKIEFVSRQLSIYFPEQKKQDFKHTVRFSFKNPLNIESACSYFLKHDYTKPEKLKLLYFLVKVAAVDGQINQHEVAFLRKLCVQLHIIETELDSIIQQYNELNQQKTTYQNKSQSTFSKITEAFQQLGIVENTSWEEIKKAYRNLAKKYHPDMCKDLSEAEFIKAQNQFIRIQNAYETLEKNKN